MRERILLFLSNRNNALIVFLASVVIVDVALLVFVPYRYHQWVEDHYQNMMWVAIVLLALIIVVLIHQVLEYDSRLQQLALHDDNSHNSDMEEMYRFYDEKGELKLLVRSEMVYYLEGADNYVIIYYAKSGKMEHLMVRNTLKNIEWRFRDHNLVRCHRSYIVNFSKVKMLKRAEGEILLDMGEGIPNIPVSKTYSETIINRLSK